MDNTELTPIETAAIWESLFRARLKILSPGIGDPPDNAKVAALLFKLIRRPPSEFRQMRQRPDQLVPFVDQAIAIHANEIATAETKTSNTTQAQTKPIGRPRKSQPRATVNARMIDELGRNKSSRDWSLREWATHLQCSTGAVVKTMSWKIIVADRYAEKSSRKSRTPMSYEQ